ncbi:sodium:solute symporter family protein [Botrimarina hoheduenensis]|uniref:Sodium/glucose cotransporter n=1 Tax=Botrimarina hoheduenensis TaxID=2528000 RepID=A0A5C5WB05_9BACT|nr:sodium:solute symporter family protein [Botrimarina hoheduenensis]TWT46792.1 Sodium/glucose cotransporter [Botrimarina hoheduenensis]
MLIFFVVVYLLASIALGLWFARGVSNTSDYAVAGRSLPLSIIIATTFATWFGSETVIGIPAKFIEGGMRDTAEDPWGAALCLILVGMFFARKLYGMTLLTINDYYRQRYGMAVEVFCSLASILSYLGWVAAQITALGLVFSHLLEDSITPLTGTYIATVVVLFYTMYGGMFSVAITDFIQMIVIVICLTAIAIIAGNMAGGPARVLEVAQQREMLNLFPPLDAKSILFYIGSAITLMLGSIPQQDIFQRVMSAKSADIAAKGAMIGGAAYLLFAFIPMYVVTTGYLLMPSEMEALIADDAQKVLPTLITMHMHPGVKAMFFGALLAAIMSTASATILAPSTVFVQNLLRNFVPSMSDRMELLLMRITVVVFTLLVLVYSLVMEGASVYDLVSSAYQVPLVSAFVPLVAGLYWPRANNSGAILSIVLGISVWSLFCWTPLGEAFPQQLAGLIAAVVGMVAGSILTTKPTHELAESIS